MKKRLARGAICALIVVIMVAIWHPEDAGLYVVIGALSGGCVED